MHSANFEGRARKLSNVQQRGSSKHASAAGSAVAGSAVA
jgi:hypothetical protein